MRILIVGLNHQIQRAEILSSGDAIVDLETNQKQQFADLLARLIQDRQVTFLGEEAQESVELIACKVASQPTVRPFEYRDVTRGETKARYPS